ncbi:MAG: citrate (Si)-synthase [Deltaproteobacteria bacterium]|nr:MAG: citrate (Si)-synthase [Deltaproteobacteria bacterium]
MSDTVTLTIDGKSVELPLITGSEGERAIDIGKLRATTGLVTIDAGFKNTASTLSGITFLDGEKGILRYRGYPIEQLAEKSTFVEASYLVLYGELPTKEQLANFRERLTMHSLLHEDMKHFFDGFPAKGHPMGILAAMIGSLSAYYPDSLDPDSDTDLHIARLMSKVSTIAAFGYKRSIGQPFMYPKNSLDYGENFFRMMFGVPSEDYEPDPLAVAALNALLILHIDHEQNCSTSTVRLVGSSDASIYASVSAGISALWGPLHGGANQAVMNMLREIRDSGGDYRGFMEQVKDKSSGRRLMGFGHRVYKSYDPRAKILKTMADKVLPKMGASDPLLDIAQELEQIALKDSYFVERNLYPNVDFYSGITYRALGIPENMFTVMFSLGRLPGWMAQWREMNQDPRHVIGRPRQIYTGAGERNYVPVGDRKGK